MAKEIPKVLILEDEDGCSAIWLQTGFVSQGITAEFAVGNLIDAISMQEKLERDLGREPWAESEPASPRYFKIWEAAVDWRPESSSMPSMPADRPSAPSIRPQVRRRPVENHATAE